MIKIKNSISFCHLQQYATSKMSEKVTHRYHSVDALNFFSLPKEVPGPMPV
jgi:hypothetical protein